MGTCICMAESLRCRPETVTTLFVNWLYLNTILKVKKKKKQHWRVFTVSRPHCVCPHSRCVCFPCHHCLGSRLLCRELSEAGPGLYALPRSKPLRFRRSGSPQRHRLGSLRFVPFLGLSSSGDQVFGEHSCCDLSPPQSLLVRFLGVQLAHLLRRMLTIQNPKKS